MIGKTRMTLIICDEAIYGEHVADDRGFAVRDSIRNSSKGGTMGANTSPGICATCRQEFSKNRMTKHIADCAQTKAGSDVWYHLIVQGLHAPEYWLHLRAQPRAQLNDLDEFLRDIWLECCWHMSDFEIEGQCYMSAQTGDFEDRSMAVALGRILQPGTKFTHTYDFGTSTELALRVVAYRRSAPVKGKITLLARNQPPEIVCEVCASPATQLCTECSWQGSGWLCEGCASKHECGSDMFLPIVNSPRVGQCGYTGG